MLPRYKPWNNSIEEILDDPKDVFTIHLINCMWDENFSETILMNLLCVKIAMRFEKIEETTFGIVNDHTPTSNRNNEIMVSAEEVVRERKDDINIDEEVYMDLGKDHCYSQTMVMLVKIGIYGIMKIMTTVRWQRCKRKWKKHLMILLKWPQLNMQNITLRT